MRLANKDKEKIREYFIQKPEIAAVYLYGSYAKKSAGSKSDVDLAVIVEDRSSYGGFDLPQTRYLYDLSHLLRKEVEVADLGQAPVDFAYRVISEGRLLYGLNSKKRVEFEEKILRDFFDMKPAIKEYFYYLRKIAKKGELGARYI